MSPFRIYHSLAALVYSSNVFSYIVCIRNYPLLLYALPQLCEGARQSLGHSLFQQPPHIFYRVQVRRVSRLVHLVYTTPVVELLCELGSMWRSTVFHQHSTSDAILWMAFHPAHEVVYLRKYLFSIYFTRQPSPRLLHHHHRPLSQCRNASVDRPRRVGPQL